MDKETLFIHLVFKTQYGSRLYGTNDSKSDTDWKYLFLPTLKDVLLGKQIMKTKFVSPNVEDKSLQVDEDFIPVQKFAYDFLKGVPYAIEIAYGADGSHAEQKYINVLFQSFVQELKEQFLNKKLSGFLGFVNNISNKVIKGHMSNGLEFKDLYHGIRIAHQAIELLTKETLTLPYDEKTVNFLLSVKNEEMLMKDVCDSFLKKSHEMELALEETKLQELTPQLEVTFENWLYKWMVNFYDLRGMYLRANVYV